MATSSKEGETQNCWEFLECPKEIKGKCLAYQKKLGDTCWLIITDAGKGCYGYNKYNGCINCPWFKKNNPDRETP